MSHFTTIQTQIRDLEALRDACGELGLGFIHPAPSACTGSKSTCSLAARPKTARLKTQEKKPLAKQSERDHDVR